ncbi:phage tail tape measure protein [Komagataeibacter intermedius]|uniref:Phage tail lysozyme domain-containing protein n=1 Tax=Komagataeibacter intermedius NRIC 0521 TaxID=1307934 RepID=A0ABQ0PGJ8_9PROT|nr:hypothetical protein [Komagataeibacter intermedius]GAN86340.1 phage related protein [Komagataeibacter intermedius TF2]GBQ67896.1 hypothetical protein AA0521_1098 [Komagataeibacter intermedius NRIC 0521]
MATVIDAFVVTLGLDPKGVQKGQKEADTSFGKVKSSAQNMGKSVDAAATGGAQAIRTMSREALSFFAVLTAGKSLKAFVQDNTRSNVALGNLSRNLGVSAQSLGTWQKVAQSFGGTAEDVSGSMQSLVSQFQTVEGRTNLGLTFGQMGVRLQGANGQLRDMNEMLPDLARAAQHLGPQTFSALASQRGFSQGFINMLEQGPDKIDRLYRALKDSAPTDADLKASAQLQMDWIQLTAQSESFARTIMTDATPAIHAVLQEIIKLEKENPGLIKGIMAGTVAVSALGAAAVGLLTILGGVGFVRGLMNLERLAKVSGSIEKAEKAGKSVSKTGSVAKEAGAVTREAEAVAEEVTKPSTMKTTARIVGRGLSTLNLAADAVAVGDLLWNGAEPAISKNDTTLNANERKRFAPASVPYQPRSILSQIGIDEGQYQTYAQSVASIEHAAYGQMGGAGNKYAGRYQMGAGAILDASRYLGEKAPTRQQFLSDPQMQERYFEAYSAINDRYLSRHSDKYWHMSPEQRLQVLGYAHNQGMGGALKWLQTGHVGRDANGTAGTEYSNLIAKGLLAKREDPPVVASNSTTNNNHSTTNHVQNLIDATNQSMQSAQNNSTSNSTVNNNSHITGNYNITVNGADPAPIKQAVMDGNRNLARQANSAFPA